MYFIIQSFQDFFFFFWNNSPAKLITGGFIRHVNPKYNISFKTIAISLQIASEFES